MKVVSKIGSLALSAVLFASSLSLAANAQETELNQNILSETVTEMDAEMAIHRCDALEDGIFELLPQFETLSNEADSVESLIDSIECLSNISVLGDNNDRKIEISDVQIFRDVSDYEDGVQVTEGELKDNMIVKVLYDEGDSWMQYSINPVMPNELFSVPSSSASNSYGFTLPLDNMTSDDYTCAYGCEQNGVLCDWCIETNQGYANRIHYGQDIAWSGIGGTPIRAVSAGIATTGYERSWGNWVMITHNNGLKTRYAHMRDLSTVAGGVLQGSIIGYVGTTGLSTAEHLHFEVYNSSGTRVNPVPYLNGASKFIVPTGTTKNYIIADGPLTLRSSPSTTSTSYGTLANGTAVTITTVQQGNGNYIFGLISSGTYMGKWISLGTLSGEIYAVDMTNLWKVYDGPLNVRASASTSASSSGTIANGTTFKITDATLNGNYLFAKITSVTVGDGSTCLGTTAQGKWIALKSNTGTYCTPYYK